MAKKKDEETKAVATKDANLPAELDGSWGAEDASKEDLILPKILLMQGISQLVMDGAAKIGEFRDSLEKRLLGSDKEPVEVIVFGSFKTWVVSIDKDFDSIIPYTSENANLPLQEVGEDESIITRDKVLNFYCLLPSDIAKGEAFPLVLSCKRTSYTAGKKIVTQMEKLKMFKKPIASKVIGISCTKETNDDGTFFVMDANVVRDTTVAELTEAKQWHTMLMKSKVRVDESEGKSAASTTDPQRDVTAQPTM